MDTGIIDISFDRPELSPGLAKLPQSDSRYAEALAIIRSGQESLKKNPNPDAEGFVACEADQQRERKYEARAEISAATAKPSAKAESFTTLPPSPTPSPGPAR